MTQDMTATKLCLKVFRKWSRSDNTIFKYSKNYYFLKFGLHYPLYYTCGENWGIYEHGVEIKLQAYSYLKLKS